MMNELYVKSIDGRLSEREFLTIGWRLESILGLKFISFDPELNFRLDSGETQSFSVEFGLNIIQKTEG